MGKLKDFLVKIKAFFGTIGKALSDIRDLGMGPKS